MLFLNKVDLLKEKIRKGVSIRKYLTSYGDRANDVPTLIKCMYESSFFTSLVGIDIKVDVDLKTKFKETCYQRSPISRPLFTYAISATVLAPQYSFLAVTDYSSRRILKLCRSP